MREVNSNKDLMRNLADFESIISELPRQALQDALVVIYDALFCDNNGEYSAAESVAGDSAADFVDVVTDVLIDKLLDTQGGG